MTFKHRSAAEQILFLLRKPPRRGTKPAAARKAAKATAHRESTGAIREAVFARAGNYCELCLSGLPTEMHHLEGGSGRRALQRASNCVAVCFLCHRQYHRDAEQFRVIVALWCLKHGYPAPRRFLRPAPAAQPNGNANEKG